MLGESVPSHTIHWVNNSRDESTRTSTWKQKTINTELLLLIFFPPPTLRLSSVFSKCVLLFEFFFFSKKSSSSKKNFTTLRGVGKNICRARLWNNKNTLKAATFLHRKQSRKHSTKRRSLAVLLLPCSRPVFPPPPERRLLHSLRVAQFSDESSCNVRTFVATTSNKATLLVWVLRAHEYNQSIRRRLTMTLKANLRLRRMRCDEENVEFLVLFSQCAAGAHTFNSAKKTSPLRQSGSPGNISTTISEFCWSRRRVYTMWTQRGNFYRRARKEREIENLWESINPAT